MESNNQWNYNASDQFFAFESWLEGGDPAFAASEYLQDLPYVPVEIDAGIGIGSALHEEPNSSETGTEKKDVKERFAFKTKSEVEILDDGYKWRKYGKKMVKNSPNPRNYYKCAVEGCSVKKRVERDREDPRYVITMYEGVHNHQGP
ncbi:hypothetical protein SAY86_021629 [Trapa natans]|uniref:WRKY domain-containing protein n=1 Tax=Trapa natans TaxID=22666 RepID=A0AAN7MKR8_TRANT|nr:hypothetical protein SAY86_021629 [Trapa natans]